MYLSDLITALSNELKSFFSDVNGSIIFDTGLGQDISASLPLCIFCLDTADESAHVSGQGATRMDYEITFSIYPWEPNSYLSDDNGYSASLADIVDNLRSFLEIGNWQTDEMKALLTNYGFRMEYQGTSKADALSMAEGLCLGFKHRFSSIAFDNSTSDTSNGNTSGTKSGTVVFQGMW